MPQLPIGCFILDSFDMKCVKRDVMLTDTRRNSKVECWWDFCERYLMLLEHHMFHWIQIRKEETETLQALGKVTMSSVQTYRQPATQWLSSQNLHRIYEANTHRKCIWRQCQRMIESRKESYNCVWTNDKCNLKQNPSLTRAGMGQTALQAGTGAKEPCWSDDLSIQFTPVWVWNGA